MRVFQHTIMVDVEGQTLSLRQAILATARTIAMASDVKPSLTNLVDQVYRHMHSTHGEEIKLELTFARVENQIVCNKPKDGEWWAGRNYTASTFKPDAEF